MNTINARWGNRVISILILTLAFALVSRVASAYLFPQTATLHLGKGKFTTRIADTEAKRIKGLSGTSQLQPNEAMVLVFETNGRWSIWMKDMNYSLDIVWLDESKRVVDYVMNVPPSSYPNKVFSPKKEARYVVELPSGTISAKSIEVGGHAVFSNTGKDL